MKRNMLKPISIMDAAKLIMRIVCFTCLLATATIGKVRAQCPSTYNLLKIGTGVRLTGSEPGVYYRLFKDGQEFDAMQEGTGGFLEWQTVCTGSYTVVAYKEGCGSVTVGGPVTFTGVSLGNPSVPTASSYTRCQGGGNTQFSSTAANASYYMWTITPGAGSVSSTGLVTWESSYSGTATITVTAYGCNTYKTASRNVTVTPNVGTPSVITGGSSTRCRGAGSTTFSSIASNETHHEWSVLPTDAGEFDNEQGTGRFDWNPAFSGSAVITYKAYGCGSPRTRTKTITVTPLATKPTFTSGITSRCQGSGTSAYKASSSNAASYQWSISPSGTSGAGSITGTGNTGTVTWRSGFSGTATITVRAVSCDGSVTAATTRSVTVKPLASLPSVPTPATGGTTRCQGDGSTTFNTSSSNAEGYEWKITAGAGSIPTTTTNPSATVEWSSSFSGTAVISVRAKSCDGSFTAYRTRNITVTPNVGTPGTITGGPAGNVRCQGAGFNTFSTLATNATSYTWSATNGAAKDWNQTTGQIEWEPTFSGTTTIKVIAEGCGSPTTRSITITVTPKVTPTISIASNVGADIDEGAAVTFTATATHGGSAPVYQWKINGSNVGTNSSTFTTSSLQNGQLVSCTLTSNSSCASTATATSNAIAMVVNQRPYAHAGADKVVHQPASTTTLTGSGNDMDGSITAYGWTKVSGPAATITSPSTATTAINNLVAGTYVFRLTVTDNKGATGTDDITVFVNQRPTVNAGANKVLPAGSTSTTLTGSGSDAEGAVTYQWTKVSGSGTPIFGTPTQASTTVTGLTSGSYVFRLTVTDTHSSTAYDELNLRINVRPTADAGEEGTVIAPETSIELSGSGTDTDGTIASYSWSRLSGPNTPTITGGTTTTPTISGLVVGNYVFRLTVTDNDGETDTDDVAVSVVAAASNYNYIRETTVRVAGATTTGAAAGLPYNEKAVTTTYYDGLGRPIQVVQHRASQAGYDIVRPIAYDYAGREARQYLPYRAAGTAYGTYRTNAIAAQGMFYNSPPAGVVSIVVSGGTTPSFSEAVFENSPLSRVLEQGAPGVAWKAGSGHTVRTDYLFNNAIVFSADPVNSRQAALYSATIAANGTRTLTRAGNNATYDAGELQVIVTKDENWTSGRAGTTEQYTDKNGRVVLSRTYTMTGTTVSQLSTYYVYDDFDNLSFVLPPGANPDAAAAISSATLNAYAYRYQYDDRQRLVAKKLPGKGWEYMVYNALDQVVATQDSVQRMKAPQEWTVTKYDGFGRVVLTGLYHYGSTAGNDYRSTLQAVVDAQTGQNHWEERTGTAYTNRAWPTSGIATTLTVQYYDDYNVSGFPAAYNKATSHSDMLRGLPTVSRTKVLGAGTGTDNMLWGATYYDDLGYAARQLTQHYQGGAIAANKFDDTSIEYNFTGAVTESVRKHHTASATTPAVMVASEYTYDAVGRPVDTWKTVTGGMRTLLANNSYNEIGQLHMKKLHGTGGGEDIPESVTLSAAESVGNGETLEVLASGKVTLSPGFHAASGSTFRAAIGGVSVQTITYGYNERGWLRTQSAPLFALQLNYNTGTVPQYNGNISSQQWGVPGNLDKVYEYRYDALNRLEVGVMVGGKYREQLVYNNMGNITKLTRTAGSTSLVDSLGYSYSGNRLTSVADAISAHSTVPYQLPGATSYTYDGNGNQLTRVNGTNTGNNITATSYNYLNLPESVTTPSGSITYTYDATGRKLRRVSGTQTIDYVDGIQYLGANIDFIQTEVGRIYNQGGSYQYEYTLTDHLGNARVNFDINGGSARRIQADDYYPFGLTFNNYLNGTKNNYLYNGKELQEGLGQYDYGARFYDPVIGRWGTADPLIENHQAVTPYAYVLNNPLFYIDPFGLDTVRANNVTAEQWKNFNTNVDVFKIDEVNITRSISIDYPFSGGLSSIGDSNNYQEKIDGSETSNSKNWESNVIYYSGKAAGTISLGIDIRKFIETEYLRQARLNRQIAGDFSRPIPHNLRGLMRNSVRLGVVGVVLTGGDIAYNGLNVSNSLDLIMGGVGFTGVGAPFAAGYFIINLGVEMYSGQTIGQHLQGTFTDPNTSLKIWQQE